MCLRGGVGAEGAAAGCAAAEPDERRGEPDHHCQPAPDPAHHPGPSRQAGVCRGPRPHRHLTGYH